MGNYLERGTVYPSDEVQARYPLAEHPCADCENVHLPHLVDNSVEFYWEHQWKGGARSVCKRFMNGRAPHEDTATPTYCRREITRRCPKHRFSGYDCNCDQRKGLG